MFVRGTLFLLLVVSAVSIYEDQIGLYDWHRSYIGSVVYQVVEAQVIVVTTDKHMLAALSLKTGDILWKYKFTAEDSVLKEPVLSGDLVITYHGSNHVRHWDLSTGVLSLDTAMEESSELLCYTAAASDTIVRFTRDNVSWGKMGTLGSSSVQIPADMKFAGYLRSGSKIEVFVYKAMEQGMIVEYDSHSNAVSTVNVELMWSTEDVKFAVSDDSVAAIVGEVIYYKVFGNHSFRNSILSEIGVTWPVNKLLAAGKSTFIVSGNDKSAILVLKDGVMKAVKAINKEVIGQVVGSDHVTLLSRSDDTVSLVQLSNGFEQHSYDMGDVAVGRGDVLSVRTLPSSHPCSLVTSVKVPGLLVTWEDGSVAVLGSSVDCGWIREESLASVVTATMVDLPASSVTPVNLKKHSNPLSMWTERIFNQFSDLHKVINIYFGSAFGEISPEMERDSFNLNKLIFAVTAKGKAHVLHSSSGRIIWSRNLEDIKPLSNSEFQVHLVRSSSHYPLPPLVAVLGASLKGDKTVVIVVNPMDGATHFRKEYPSKLAQVQLSNVEDNEFTKVLLILTQDNQVHTYPPRSHDLVKSLPIFFSLVFPDTMQLKGLRMRGTRTEETWSTHLRGDKVVAMESKASNDAVYSQGRVLGDRSVLHKYINPHVMGVAVQSGAVEKAQIDVQLYDMVSGAQLYHARHKQYSGPVHMLIAENWLVYHLYSTKLRRFEVVIVEFFLPAGIKASEFSSLNPYAPAFSLQQSYISTSAITSIAVTTTLKSITNRAVLFGDTNGRICLIPKAVLDPRRPTIPTAEDRTEQLIPYKPQLDLSPVSYVSYNKILDSVSGIVTGVTGLESTSLLFVYGTDLFFTRVTPAKTFDLLNEDFDYYLIGMVLLGLCLGTIVTQALSENKALNKKWK